MEFKFYYSCLFSQLCAFSFCFCYFSYSKEGYPDMILEQCSNESYMCFLSNRCTWVRYIYLSKWNVLCWRVGAELFYIKMEHAPAGRSPCTLAFNTYLLASLFYWSILCFSNYENYEWFSNSILLEWLFWVSYTDSMCNDFSAYWMSINIWIDGLSTFSLATCSCFGNLEREER